MVRPDGLQAKLEERQYEEWIENVPAERLTSFLNLSQQEQEQSFGTRLSVFALQLNHSQQSLVWEAWERRLETQGNELKECQAQLVNTFTKYLARKKEKDW